MYQGGCQTKEAIRQWQSDELLRDIYAVERIKPAPAGARGFVLALNCGQHETVQRSGELQSYGSVSVEPSQPMEVFVCCANSGWSYVHSKAPVPDEKSDIPPGQQDKGSTRAGASGASC